MNPFITLTTLDGQAIDINVTNICLYEKRGYRDSTETYTYIVFQSGGAVTRNVRETYETIQSRIQNYYTQQLYTQK